MQQLAEGNIELRPSIQHRRKKKEAETKKTNNKNVPYKKPQTTLDNHLTKKFKTLLDYL